MGILNSDLTEIRLTLAESNLPVFIKILRGILLRTGGLLSCGGQGGTVRSKGQCPSDEGGPAGQQR